MKAFRIALRLAVSCATAAPLYASALLYAASASAQMYRPEPLGASSVPPLAMGLSSPQSIDVFDSERGGDIFAFEVFGGHRRLDQFNVSNAIDRPGPWVFYGRFYLLNFQNQLNSSEDAGIRIGFGRTGPSIAGRIYIGIRKRF
jgi:hypothetical protein